MNAANPAKTMTLPGDQGSGERTRARHLVVRVDPARADHCEKRVIHSQSLFESGRELVIRHGGADYLLRITSQNKLILTK
jgi:hemin uptake protein HemP